jgi:hypothetical protein
VQILTEEEYVIEADMKSAIRVVEGSSTDFLVRAA